MKLDQRMRDGMDTCALRRVRISDADELRALKVRASAEFPTQFLFAPEDVQSAPTITLAAGMSEPGSVDRTFGAYLEGHLIGSAEFVREPLSKAAHRGEMKAVYVIPEARGCGVAQRLIERLIGYAAQHVQLLHAAVGLDNIPARRLYARAGFRPYGVHPSMIRHLGQDIGGELLLLDLRSQNRQSVASSQQKLT